MKQPHLSDMRAVLLGVTIGMLLFTLMSCKETLRMDSSITYPPILEDQIALFKRYSDRDIKIRPLTIVLVNELYTRKGVRVNGVTIYRKHLIKLDTSTWAYKNARTKLVMHELGHYVYRREHFYETKETLIEVDGFPNLPTSFMSIGPLATRPSDFQLELSEDMAQFYMLELVYN